MKSTNRDPIIDHLFRAILSLQNIDECYEFFEDLCTIFEIRDLSKRLLAARMLLDNRVYSDIAEQTGLSTSTISRVKKNLQFGREGYTKVLDRIGYKERSEKF